MQRQGLLLLLLGTCWTGPVPQSAEVDSEESRRVLGSSVVTSVSVIMDLGNGTKAFFADAAGRPVPRPPASSPVGSPVELLSPDRYEFYTFDEFGDLVRRYMTLDQIQSIIASGDGEVRPLPGQPDDRRPASGHGPVAAATDVGDVIASVQNVLRGAMGPTPVTPSTTKRPKPQRPSKPPTPADVLKATPRPPPPPGPLKPPPPRPPLSPPPAPTKIPVTTTSRVTTDKSETTTTTQATTASVKVVATTMSSDIVASSIEKTTNKPSEDSQISVESTANVATSSATTTEAAVIESSSQVSESVNSATTLSAEMASTEDNTSLNDSVNFSQETNQTTTTSTYSADNTEKSTENSTEAYNISVASETTTLSTEQAISNATEAISMDVVYESTTLVSSSSSPVSETTSNPTTTTTEELYNSTVSGSSMVIDSFNESVQNDSIQNYSVPVETTESQTEQSLYTTQSTPSVDSDLGTVTNYSQTPVPELTYLTTTTIKVEAFEDVTEKVSAATTELPNNETDKFDNTAEYNITLTTEYLLSVPDSNQTSEEEIEGISTTEAKIVQTTPEAEDSPTTTEESLETKLQTTTQNADEYLVTQQPEFYSSNSSEDSVTQYSVQSSSEVYSTEISIVTAAETETAVSEEDIIPTTQKVLTSSQAVSQNEGAIDSQNDSTTISPIIDKLPQELIDSLSSVLSQVSDDTNVHSISAFLPLSENSSMTTLSPDNIETVTTLQSITKEIPKKPPLHKTPPSPSQDPIMRPPTKDVISEDIHSPHLLPSLAPAKIASLTNEGDETGEALHSPHPSPPLAPAKIPSLTNEGNVAGEAQHIPHPSPPLTPAKIPSLTNEGDVAGEAQHIPHPSPPLTPAKIPSLTNEGDVAGEAQHIPHPSPPLTPAKIPSLANEGDETGEALHSPHPSPPPPPTKILSVPNGEADETVLTTEATIQTELTTYAANNNVQETENSAVEGSDVRINVNENTKQAEILQNDVTTEESFKNEVQTTTSKGIMYETTTLFNTDRFESDLIETTTVVSTSQDISSYNVSIKSGNTNDSFEDSNNNSSEDFVPTTTSKGPEDYVSTFSPETQIIDQTTESIIVSNTGEVTNANIQETTTGVISPVVSLSDTSSVTTTSDTNTETTTTAPDDKRDKETDTTPGYTTDLSVTTEINSMLQMNFKGETRISLIGESGDIKDNETLSTTPGVASSEMETTTTSATDEPAESKEDYLMAQDESGVNTLDANSASMTTEQNEIVTTEMATTYASLLKEDNFAEYNGSVSGTGTVTDSTSNVNETTNDTTTYPVETNEQTEESTSEYGTEVSALKGAQTSDSETSSNNNVTNDSATTENVLYSSSSASDVSEAQNTDSSTTTEVTNKVSFTDSSTSTKAEEQETDQSKVSSDDVASSTSSSLVTTDLISSSPKYTTASSVSNPQSSFTTESDSSPAEIADNNLKDGANQPTSISSPVDLRPSLTEHLGLEATTAALDRDLRQFSDLCNELALRLWAAVAARGATAARSLVMSPFAVTSLLAMVFLGARGPTSTEMNDLLKLDDMVTFNPHLIFRNITETLVNGRTPGIASVAFVRQLYSDKNKGKLLDFYKDRAQQFYDGHVEEANFRVIGELVRRRTNLLVKRHTGGRVPTFFRGSGVALRSPLAAFSANVLQTDCSDAGIEGRDGEMYFTVSPSLRQRRLIPVPAAVWRQGIHAGYDPQLDATVAALGVDSAVSMIYVLPGQHGNMAPGDGLPLLERRLLTPDAWSRLMRSLLPRPGLELQVPRFSHRSLLNATGALQRLGLRDLLTPGRADLRGLNGLGDLYLSDVLAATALTTCAGETSHTEAYPARAARLARRLDADFSDLPLALRPRQARRPPAPARLHYDRPFFYAVRHNPTGIILHMGRFNPRLP